jgi:CBS domain-containing protein
MTVSRILSVKGRAVVTAASGDTVQDVSRKLSTHRIGAVVIVDQFDEIEGIVSERDIVRIIGIEGASALSKAVSTIMSRNVKTCRETDSEQALMGLMTDHRIRHLPVVTGNKLAGMISIGDVVKNRIETIEKEAADMKAYISSAG